MKKSKIILYYSKSCPYSNKMFSEWLKFLKYAKNNLKYVDVITNNCTENFELARNDGIRAFPTIILIYAKSRIEFTSKNRTCDEFINFVKKYVQDSDLNKDTSKNISLLDENNNIIIEI